MGRFTANNLIFALFLIVIVVASFSLMAGDASAYEYTDAYTDGEIEVNKTNGDAVTLHSKRLLEYRDYSKRTSNEILSDMIQNSRGVTRTYNMNYTFPQYETMLYASSQDLHETQPRFYDLLHVYLEDEGINNEREISKFFTEKKHTDERVYEGLRKVTGEKGSKGSIEDLPYERLGSLTNASTIDNYDKDDIAVPTSVINNIHENFPGFLNDSGLLGSYIGDHVDSVKKNSDKTYGKWNSRGYLPLKASDDWRKVLFREFRQSSNNKKLGYEPKKRLKKHLYITHRLGFEQSKVFARQGSQTYESPKPISQLYTWNNNQVDNSKKAVNNPSIRDPSPGFLSGLIGFGCSIVPPGGPLSRFCSIYGSLPFFTQYSKKSVSPNKISVHASGSDVEDEAEYVVPPNPDSFRPFWYTRHDLRHRPREDPSEDGKGGIFFQDNPDARDGCVDGCSIDRSTPSNLDWFPPTYPDPSNQDHVYILGGEHITKIMYNNSVRVGAYTEKIGGFLSGGNDLYYSRKANDGPPKKRLQHDTEEMHTFNPSKSLFGSSPGDFMIPVPVISNNTVGNFLTDYTNDPTWSENGNSVGSTCCTERNDEGECISRTADLFITDNNFNPTIEFYGLYDYTGGTKGKNLAYFNTGKKVSNLEIGKHINKNVERVKLVAYIYTNNDVQVGSGRCIYAENWDDTEEEEGMASYVQYYKVSEVFNINYESKKDLDVEVPYVIDAYPHGSYYEVNITHTGDSDEYGYWSRISSTSLPDDKILAKGSWRYMSARAGKWSSTHYSIRDTRSGEDLQSKLGTEALISETNYHKEYVDDFNKISPVNHYAIPDPRSYSNKQEVIPHGDSMASDFKDTTKMYNTKCTEFAFYNTCSWNSDTDALVKERVNSGNNSLREAGLVSGFTKYDIGNKSNITVNRLTPNTEISVEPKVYLEQVPVNMTVESIDRGSGSDPIEVELSFSGGGSGFEVKPDKVGETLIVKGSGNRERIVSDSSAVSGNTVEFELHNSWSDSFFLEFRYKVDRAAYAQRAMDNNLDKIPYVKDKKKYTLLGTVKNVVFIVGVIFLWASMEYIYTKLLVITGTPRREAKNSRLIPIFTYLYIPKPTLRWRRFIHYLNAVSLTYWTKRLFPITAGIEIEGKPQVGESVDLTLAVEEDGDVRSVKWHIGKSPGRADDMLKGKSVSTTWNAPGEYEIIAVAKKGPKKDKFSRMIEVSEGESEDNSSTES